MKKLTTIFTGMLLLFLASSFTTTDVYISTRVKTAFENNFSKVDDLKWAKTNDVYVASFTVKGQYLTAAYNEEGELLSTARYINLSQLPLNISQALRDTYAGYSINPTCIELSHEGTVYFIKVQNEKYELKIKADASANLNVESRTKK